MIPSPIESVALVIGIVFAFILHSLDTGMRNETEAVSGPPSLALIPRHQQGGTGTALGAASLAMTAVAIPR